MNGVCKSSYSSDLAGNKDLLKKSFPIWKIFPFFDGFTTKLCLNAGHFRNWGWQHVPTVPPAATRRAPPQWTAADDAAEPWAAAAEPAPAARHG